MAAFDTNLMLRNTTETVGTLLSLAAANGLIFTGNWLTLGTNASGGPLTIRASIGTAISNTDTLTLDYELSDDQSTINETVKEYLTGTMFIGTIAGALVPSIGDVITRVPFKRRYIRVRGTGKGYNANFGVVTIGVDAGDVSNYR